MREFQKPKKSVDRSCRLRSAPAIVRSSSSRRQVRTTDPFSFICIRGTCMYTWHVCERVRYFIPHYVLLHVALREVTLSSIFTVISHIPTLLSN